MESEAAGGGEMGGGDQQETTMDRAKNPKRRKAADEGSQFETNKKAMNVQELKSGDNGSLTSEHEYKEVACTTEMALKNIESLCEAYKEESEARKKTYQDELLILQTELSELEKKIDKYQEFSAAPQLEENEAISDDITQKMSQAAELNLVVSNLKVEFGTKQKYYQSMKESYDRQVALQSLVIEELPSTPKQISSLLSALANISNKLRAENVNTLISSLLSAFANISINTLRAENIEVAQKACEQGESFLLERNILLGQAIQLRQNLQNLREVLNRARGGWINSLHQ